MDNRSTYGECPKCGTKGEMFAAHNGLCSYCFHIAGKARSLMDPTGRPIKEDGSFETQAEGKAKS